LIIVIVCQKVILSEDREYPHFSHMKKRDYRESTVRARETDRLVQRAHI